MLRLFWPLNTCTVKTLFIEISNLRLYFWMRGGNLKMTDFGLSKRGNKTTYTIVGTPEYQPPEILKGEGHYR